MFVAVSVMLTTTCTLILKGLKGTRFYVDNLDEIFATRLVKTCWNYLLPLDGSSGSEIVKLKDRSIVLIILNLCFI